MNTNDIKILLEKFYNGETSTEEEKALADFFLGEGVPDEFLSDRRLFCALSETPVEVPYESTQAVESLIDSFREEQPARKSIKTFGLTYSIAGVAASLALIFGVIQYQKNRQQEATSLADTYKTPDEAYRATVDALQLFSENFSKGTESMEKANRHLEKAQEIINQSLK